jgi:ABC-type dipeptide/oligopeptide/nickel transport system ATPase subunit
VQYIPQRPSLLPGTPLDFLTRIQSFASRRKSSSDSQGSDKDDLDPYTLAEEWGIPRTMWAREWSTLSGGEGQRIALAIAIGIGGAEVILLDGESSSFFLKYRAGMADRGLNGRTDQRIR